MKRFLILLVSLSVLLSGCALGLNNIKEPVTFYYPRPHDHQEDYDDFFLNGTMGSELREASGHRQDPKYLLSMYLQGPLSEDLTAPFPQGSKAVDILREDGSLTVTLNAAASYLNDMELTVSCACLATTCMELVDADTVTVQAIGIDKQILFTRSFTESSLLLEDFETPSYTETEDTQ